MGTGTGTDTETHVGEAVPEVLEEVITIDVWVRMTSFYSWLETSLGTERDRRDYRYDDRQDTGRRDREDRRRDDRRDDRDRHRDDPRDRNVPKHSEAKPPPGLKEGSGKRFRLATPSMSNPVDAVTSPPGPRTTHSERRPR